MRQRVCASVRARVCVCVCVCLCVYNIYARMRILACIQTSSAEGKVKEMTEVSVERASSLAQDIDTMVGGSFAAVYYFILRDC